MRRDVFIQNDSGGLSIIAVDAAQDIIDDGRSDDERFVKSHKALLQELYGDDSMPVRIVVDEALTPEEEAQWLARSSWRIDTTDGRVLVMGGFDPDVLASWKEEGEDSPLGGGVAEFEVPPGSWRVDLYAHAGSMNGRAILSEAKTKPGAAFRKSHPGKPMPLWLAHMLQFSGEEDPGFEEHWADVKAAMESGELSIDVEGGDAIGFLVHFTKLKGDIGKPPEGGWFALDTNARVPKVFPLGLRSDAPDPELRSFHDDLLGIEKEEAPLPAADQVVEVIEVWPGDPMKKLDAPVTIELTEVYLLHWMAAMCAESPPRFELWVEPKGSWTAPEATADLAVMKKMGGAMTAIGPAANAGGWQLWWVARDAAKALAGLGDGTVLTLAMAPRLDYDADLDPEAGRMLFEAKLAGGKLQVSEGSPKVSAAKLGETIAFVRDAASGKVTARKGAERDAFEQAVEDYVFEEDGVKWKGDVAELAEPDERTMLLCASAVFRVRFADVWKMELPEED